MNTSHLILICLVVNMFVTLPISAHNNSNILREIDPIDRLLSKLQLDDDKYQETVEYLTSLLDDPIDLNHTTVDELTGLLILSPQQIAAIVNYGNYNGGYNSIYELQLVWALDKETILLIEPFLTISNMVEKESWSFKQLSSRNQHTLMTRLDIPFYKKRGYNEVYLGSPLYNSIRYNLVNRKHFHVGFAAKKDAGEPIFNKYNRKGYDSYSYYIYLQDWRIINYLILGKYRLNYGLGLTLGTSSFGSKFDQGSNLFQSANKVYKHSSTDEYNYLKGVAISLLIKRIEISSFVSNRSYDGVINKGYITKLSKTGLHRTQKELDEKGSIQNLLYGGRVALSNPYYRLGLNFIGYNYDGRFTTNEAKPYTKYNPVGNKFYNASVDYIFYVNKFILKGELAKGKRGIATLNYLYYAPTSEHDLLLIHRFYEQDYWAMYANPLFSSARSNENGWYASYATTLFSPFKVVVYGDFCSYPWWKYRLSKPSRLIDIGAKIEYSKHLEHQLMITYRFKDSERDKSGSKGSIINRIQSHQLKFQYVYNYSDMHTVKFMLGGNKFTEVVQKYGYHLSGRYSIQSSNQKFKTDTQFSYFNTQSYDTRVYIYENAPLYSYSSYVFSGRGYRFSINLNYKPFQWLHLMCKWGMTKYLDRDVIGQSYEQIDGNLKSDVQIQLRIKF